MFRLFKISITFLLIIIPWNLTYAISKNDSIYIGKQLIKESSNMGFNMHWGVKCGFGNDLDIISIIYHLNLMNLRTIL